MNPSQLSEQINAKTSFPAPNSAEINAKMQKYLSSAEDLIFLLGIVTALALVRSRYDNIDGNRVPVFIFKNHPTLFHAFLVALNFGFTAAVVTKSLRAKNPMLAQFCRGSAVACVVAAAGFLSYSAFVLS